MSESGGKRRRVSEEEEAGEERSLLCCIDDVLEKIFGYIKKPIERNAISATCKRFREIEARTRPHVLVYNMYTVEPLNLFRRFPSVRSITIKGNPRLVDFDILPKEWAGHAGPWIAAIKANPQLNRFRIKRMMITDRQISDLCAALGPHLNIMQFDKCSGFSTAGLLSLSKYCKNLTQLGLAQSTIEDSSDTTWLTNLVDECPGLVVLDLSFIDMGDVDEAVLVKLAARCRTLKLWESQNPERFQPVLEKCSSNLTDLGIERISGSSINTNNNDNDRSESENNSTPLLAKCTGLEGLSGIFDLVEDGMHAFLSVSSRLKRLDLSYSIIRDAEIAEVLNACPNLTYLRVLDFCGDRGLEALGNSCKDLQRLVVESPSSEGGIVTHAGLMAVAQGCRNLQKLIFYPSFITNQGFEALAYNCPNLMDVRICLIQSNMTNDQLPWQCLDEGVAALVQQCKLLYRLTLCFDVKAGVEFLTDAGLAAIGQYGKKIRVLTLVHCGSTDAGLVPVLRGCHKLQRLEIRKSSFGDESMREIALNKDLHLKYLHVQGCEVTIDGLSLLAYRGKVTNSRFFVEVIGCRDRRCLEEHRESCTDDDCEEQHRYSLSCSHWQILAYHSLTEARDDAPWFIHRFDSTISDTEPGPSSLADEGEEEAEEEDDEQRVEEEDGNEQEGNEVDEEDEDGDDQSLQLMPVESGVISESGSGGGGGGGIDLNQEPESYEEEEEENEQREERRSSSFAGFGNVVLNELLDRVATEPSLHLGTSSHQLVIQAFL